MSRIGVSKRSIVIRAVLSILIVLAAVAPARASSFTFNSVTNTYTYTGGLFNFCGYGCPAKAPSDPVGVDFIIATLKFGAPLLPNLTFADPLPIPASWSMTDHFGAFTLSGVGLPTGISPDPSDPTVTPGLLLATDSSGNIVRWIMTAELGKHDKDGFFHGTQAAILNPAVFCGSDCGGLGLSDLVAVRIRSTPDREWDAGRLVAPVPEPGTLTLVGVGLFAVARRRLSTRRG